MAKRPWERDAASLKRGNPRFPQRPSVLIVCEGEKTEPTYFRALCKHRRLTAAQVKVCPSERGSHPKSVVECAVQLVEERKKADRVRKSPFEAVWCVFDRDTHANIHEAVDRANARRFRLAYSNPCFELWYILHFDYSTAPLDSRAAQSNVRKGISGYDKAFEVYDQLVARQGTAIGNAEKLRQHHEASGGLTRESNPYTTVDELVIYLNGLEATAPG